MPQIDNSNDDTIADQPISGMRYESGWDAFASRARSEAGHKRREIVIWVRKRKRNQWFSRIAKFTDEIPV
jgi:hypothetical protein